MGSGGELRADEVIAGKYRVLRELASGSMGVIYVAQHLSLGRQVAIKTLRSELLTDTDLAARFELEARAASTIGHPNVVDVFDLGRTRGGGLYMVMELLEGRSLAEILAHQPFLPVEKVVDVLAQVLSALEAAHQKHVVHRDLKPENIFIIETEARPSFVKLLDFGISKVIRPDGPAGKGLRGTIAGTVLGTPEYMSPEQARGRVEQVDARTDIYAAGVLLYELLCGRTPYQGDNYNAVLAAIVAGDYPAPRTLRPDLPAGLERVVVVAMAREREARYASAASMRDALLVAMETKPSILPPASQASVLPSPSSRVTPPSLFPRIEEPFATSLDDTPPPRPLPAPPEPMPLEIAPRPSRRSFPSARLAAPKEPWVRASTMRRVVVALVLIAAALVTVRLLRRTGPDAREVPLVIDVWPENAELFVDGKPAATRVLSLPEGNHVVTASAPGYVPRRVTIALRADAPHVPLRLGHQLVPVSPRDPGASPPAPAQHVLADLDAIFAKIDSFRGCRAASDEIHRMRERLAAARAAGRPAVMTLDSGLLDACRERIATEPAPPLPAFDAAAKKFAATLKEITPLFYVPNGEKLYAKVNGLVNVDEAFRRELASARFTVEEAELALLAADGQTAAWHMRRVTLSAQAWLFQVLVHGPTGTQAHHAAAALDAARKSLLTRLRQEPHEAAAIEGRDAFLTAADEVVSLSRSATRATAIEAFNRLVAAFNALVTG